MTLLPPESAHPVSKPRHRSRKIAVVVLAAVVALGTLAYWKRIEIASAVAGYLLAGRALPPIAFEIAALEPDHARLTAVTVGSNEELRIAETTFAYDGWAALLGGEVERVTLRGLELTADFTGDKPLLGNLTEYIPTAGDRAGPPKLPNLPVVVTLEDAIVRATTPVGPLTVEIESATYDLAAADKVAASLTARLGDGLASGAFEIGVKKEPEFAIAIYGHDGAVSIGKLSVQPIGFDARIDFREQGLPYLKLHTHDFPIVVAFAGQEVGDAYLSIDGYPINFEVKGAVYRDLTRNSVRFYLGLDRREPSRPRLNASVDVLAPPESVAWSFLDLPIETSGIAELRLVTQAVLSATFPSKLSRRTLVSGDGQVLLKLPSVTCADNRVEALSLRLPFAVLPTESGFEVEPFDVGELSIGSLRYGDLVRLPDETAVDFPDGSARIELDANTISSVGGSIDFAQATKTIIAESKASGPVKLSDFVGTLEGSWNQGGVATAKIAIQKGGINLPNYRLAGTGLKASATVGSEAPPALDWSLARLEDQADPARFPPLWLSGRANRRDGDILFTAAASGAKDRLRLSAKGRHRLATGKGATEITLAPLEFSEDALQPGDLSPLLASLTEASGQASGSARLAWPNSTGLGSAVISIENLDTTVEGITFDDLDLTLALDGLHPLSSPPGQRLTIARLDPGLPITNLVFDFRIVPGAQPKLAIESGSWEAVGGNFHVLPTTVDPLAGDSAVTIVVDRLPLDRLFELVNVEGLSGSGTVDGALPFAHRDGALVLTDGKLAAQAPGVLHFRSDAAKQYLAGSGEAVEMALRALEDFRYEELTATLDQKPDGTTLVTLSLLGHNPTVLEGHPFRFNINLETRAGELLAILTDSLRISQGLVRQLWMNPP